MRTRTLLLSSVLVLAFGCSGDDADDGADTGSNATTTGGMTTMDPMTTMSMTTAPMTTMDMDTMSMDTMSMDTMSMDTMSMDTMMADSTSGDGDSSSGSDGSSSTGGAVSAQCMTFCTDYFATCGDDAGNDYVDEAGCHTSCEGQAPADFDCREMHLGLAEGGDTATHCPHASDSGGGVC